MRSYSQGPDPFESEVANRKSEQPDAIVYFMVRRIKGSGLRVGAVERFSRFALVHDRGAVLRRLMAARRGLRVQAAGK